MHKSKINIMIVIVGLCSASMAFLFFNSEKDIRYRQNFIRINISESVANAGREYGLTSAALRIAGISNKVIYLYDTGNIGSLYTIDQNSGREQHLEVNIDKEDFVRPRMLIDSPFYYVYDGQTSSLFRGVIGHWTPNSIIDTGEMHFREILPLGKDSIAMILTVSEEGSSEIQNMMGLFLIGSQTMQFKPRALEGQLDRYFSTFGTLTYSKKLNKMVYTYRYRNAYHIIDSTMSITLRRNTIDSVSKIKFRPLQLRNNRKLFSSTVHAVNLDSKAQSDLVFIWSNLMGYENRKRFDSHSILDIYDITNYQYKGSVYIPDIEEDNKMIEYAIKQNELFVLYRNKIVSYVLDFDKIKGSESFYRNRN